MAWCLWWRESAGRALPTRARWKKIGKISSQTRAKRATEETATRRLGLNKNSIRPVGLASPFIGIASRGVELTPRSIDYRSDLIAGIACGQAHVFSWD
jgi:hypothetical protein